MPSVDHTTRFSLIRMLASGEYHSGEALGKALGISRAAINKQMKMIRSWGLDIFSIQGKGYCLAQPLDLIDLDTLQHAFSERDIFVFPVLDSTNQFLLENIGALRSGSVCVAEYQEAGRGRRGRNWYSPFGTNLYCSMYWRWQRGLEATMGLSLVVGIVLAETLTELGARNIKLKWPNDIYLNEAKLAGVLVEMTGQVGHVAHLIIGMGINISMTENENIDQSWANLSQACAQLPPKTKLTIMLINHLTKALQTLETQGMQAFLSRWHQFDNYYNRPIVLITATGNIEGICKGVNEQGAILLDVNGVVSAFTGGEISLRSNDIKATVAE